MTEKRSNIYSVKKVVNSIGNVGHLRPVEDALEPIGSDMTKGICAQRAYLFPYNVATIMMSVQPYNVSSIDY